jgi:hypothetical protein
MILDRKPLVIRPDRSRPPADVILDPDAAERFAPTWNRTPPDASGNLIPVLLTATNSGDGKRVEIYSSNHRLGTLTTADSADFLAILAIARTDGQPVMGTAVHGRDAGGRWALHVYRPEPS